MGSTSYNTLSGVGQLRYSKAELVYSKKIPSNNYKYLCDATRLIKEPSRGHKEAYVVYFGGSKLLTIVPGGWYIETAQSYNISANNRLNAYTGANIFAHRGMLFAGSNKILLNTGDFLPVEHGFKHPCGWYGMTRYYRTPHSGRWASQPDPGAMQTLVLSDPDASGGARRIEMIKKCLKLYIHYYVRNFVTLKNCEISDRALAISYDSPVFLKNPDEVLPPVRSSKHTDWGDIVDKDTIMESSPIDLNPDSPWRGTSRKMLDCYYDKYSASSFQGLNALCGKSVTADHDNIGVPEDVDLSKIDFSINYGQIRRWAWGEDKRHAYKKILFNGKLVTLGIARYEAIRLSSIRDLCNMIGFGSQLFRSNLFDDQFEARTPQSSFTTSHDAHWLHEDDLMNGFKKTDHDDDVDRYEHIERSGILVDKESVRLNSHNTCYPRSFLVKILEHYKEDETYIAHLFDKRDSSDSFELYAEEIMNKFFFSKLHAYLLDIMHSSVSPKLFSNSTLGSDWFKCNEDRTALRVHWYNREENCFSHTIEEKLKDIHPILASNKSTECIRSPEY